MSDNDELKRQIEQLETAISQRKRQGQQYQQTRPRYNPIWSTTRRGRPHVRPSHNLKLTVKHAQPSSKEGDSTDSVTTGYVSYGNKLVRVGSGAAMIRPAYTTRPRAIAPKRVVKQQTQQVVIDGEEFVRKGRGNKLVRASTTKPSVERKRIVSIDGEKYVRTKEGSLVRVEALRVLNQKQSHNGAAPTKEEEESFMKQYIQRPVFDNQNSVESDTDLAEDIISSDSEASNKDDDLSDALTDDEADELLRWYDDNYEAEA
ncbi:hypothetical protein H4S08_001923 [Coemansia sp. RSA 1365]|nr:hypothetical protein H4S08_001923 [Coemansia sp. RSA 1365]